MSVWETVQDKYRDFNHWPNPFQMTQTEMEVLACNGAEWLGFSKLYAQAFAAWFFSSFVPSPVEITRKTLTGGYKCGFYIPIRWKSPLDVVWKNGAGSFALSRGLSGPLTAAWVLWAADTIYSFFSTWTTIIQLQKGCDNEFNNCVWTDGSMAMLEGTEPNASAQSFVETWQNWPFTGASVAGLCTIEVPGWHVVNAFVDGFINPQNVVAFEAFLLVGGVEVDRQSMTPAGGTRPEGVKLSWAGYRDVPTGYQVGFSYTATSGPGIRAQAFVRKFVLSYNPTPLPPTPACFEWSEV